MSTFYLQIETFIANANLISKILETIGQRRIEITRYKIGFNNL